MYREHYEYVDDMKSGFDAVSKENRENYMDWYGWKLKVNQHQAFKDAVANFTKGAHNDFTRKMGILEMPVQDVFDYRVAQKSIDFLKKDRKKSFMLTCSFNMPHDPNVIPAEYYARVSDELVINSLNTMSKECEDYYSQELSRMLPTVCGNEFLKEFLHIYYASVLFIDDMAGKLLAALDESGERENTMILFTADHGDMAGNHVMFWKSTSSFYKDVSNVPLMISVPQIDHRRITQPVELIDIMPTILEYCNVAAPTDISGESLIDVMKGVRHDENASAMCMRLNWNREHTREDRIHDDNYSFMLVKNSYKYCVHKKDGKLHELLYHLKSDKNETVNLAENPDYSEYKAKMKKALQEKISSTGSTVIM